MSGDLDVFYVLRDAVIAERLQAFVRANWAGMAQRGQAMVVHLMTEKAERSLSQNRFYWRLLTDIAENAWVGGRRYSKDAWHEYFRERYLPKLEGPLATEHAASTASLTVKDFSAYMERIEAHAASELGIELA